MISEELNDNCKLHSITPDTKIAEGYEEDEATFIASFDMVEDIKTFMGNNGLFTVSDKLVLRGSEVDFQFFVVSDRRECQLPVGFYRMKKYYP